jgi:Uma2 family endonuclease
MAALRARTLEIDRNRLYTAEQFIALELDPGKRYELVRGVVEEMSWPGVEHTLIADNLYGALRDFARATKRGRALQPGGFELKIPGSERDTVRTPDLVFLEKSKISSQTGAFKVVPDLAVEVYSPNDEPAKLMEKLEDYQQAGWNLVWVIYPPTASPKRKAATVDIYRLQEEMRLQPALTLNLNDTLLGESVLEGFHLPVADLFDYQGEQ